MYRLRKEMFYLTTHWTHFIYGYIASSIIFSFAIFFITQRVQLIHPYYYTQPSTYKFWELMENKRISKLKKLACFINIIKNEFKRPWLQIQSETPQN